MNFSQLLLLNWYFSEDCATTALAENLDSSHSRSVSEWLSAACEVQGDTVSMLKGCCTSLVVAGVGVTGQEEPYFHLGSSNQMIWSSGHAEASVLAMVLETTKGKGVK